MHSALKSAGYAAGAAMLQTGGSADGTWRVKPGDTLWEIAQHTLGSGTEWTKLWQANRHLVPNPHALRVGTVLTIPGAKPSGPAPTAPAPAPTSGPATYTVKSGDTLSKIAAQLLGSASRWQELWNANRGIIANPNVIHIGQVLTIPGGTHTPAPPTPEAPTPDEPAPKPPVEDAGMAPDHGGLAVGQTWLEQNMAAIYNTKGRFVYQQSQALGFEAAIGAAVLSVESGGSGHVNGKLKIRFESHIFQNLSGQYVGVNHTGAQADEYAAFEQAKTVNRTAAYESISMGAAQIMGFNAQRVGYGSAEEMFDEFQVSLAAQLAGMFEFVRTSKTLHNAAKAKDWATFAYYYNGAGYKANAYDTKMANAYVAYKKVTEGLPYA